MSRYLTFDQQQIDLEDIGRRGNDLSLDRCVSLDSSAVKLSVPHLDELITAILTARRNKNPIIAMFGGHPIKLGLSRYIIDLIESGLITHVATNGAGIIHDFELALVGGTSEDVARWINVGQFGLWQETSRLNDIEEKDEG
ncbi:MAG: hypothetical protein WEB58_15215 [Planctomycetaceae bacterium]